MERQAPGYKKLQVWQRGCDLVFQVYRATAGFPKQEMYGLTSQMRRSALSIPANIAEGRERGSDADMARFLRISLGSLAELETFVYIANRLGYLHDDVTQQLDSEASEMGRMLNGLIGRLKTD